MWIEAISGGGVTPTPITPSNTTPASMTSGTAYEPTANGYAIENYDSVTPSSTPASVASGDIVKIGGSGVIVDSIPTPTSITPSNSSPVSLTANTPVKPTANGYAISSYSSLSPSSTPSTILAGSIYKAGGSGYVIDAYDNVTPTTSGTYFASGMMKMSTSGYAYSQQPSVINPADKYASAYNADAKGTVLSLTSGKTYIATWSSDNNTTTTTFTNGTKLYEKIGNGATWSSRTLYTRLVVFKATSNSVTITNSVSGSAGRMYDLIVSQLD